MPTSLTLRREGFVCFALSALVLCGAGSAFASKATSVPEWVQLAAQQTLPSLPAETNAVVLLDETTYAVAPDGHAVEHYRRVTKILRPQGRNDATVAVRYDGDMKLLSLHVWSIGPDGHEYALKDNEIEDRSPFGQGNLYEEDRIKVAHAAGADPGGIVAYEYEQKVRPYLTEKTWVFQGDVPRLKESFTLELPPGFTYGTVWAHHPNVEAVNLEHQRWRWEMNNTPAIDLDRVPMSPSGSALLGRMTVHYAGLTLPEATEGSWQSIGKWYGRLTQDRLAATPEIAAKAIELTTGKTDFYERTEAVAEFVQRQVRYFGIELGIGGYQPHAAGDIFRNRYGDCKDKATLLSAMLSTIGVHSALMMVDVDRGVVVPDAPSIVGDHMIAAIEIPKGYDSSKLRSVITAKTGRRYLIFDPTWEQTPFGQLESNLQGGYGLLFEGNDTEIVALPVLKPELNTIQRHGTFQLQADGSLKGDVTEKRFGDVSEERRIQFGQGDANEQRNYLTHILERDLTTFTISNVKTENVQALNQAFTLSYSVSAERVGKSMGSLLMIRPRLLGTEALYVDQKPRTVPIDLRETMQATDDYDIEIPAGYAIDEMPAPEKLDLGFASYQSSSEMKGNILHYSRTYIVRQVTLPPEKYADVQKLAGIINFDEMNQAVLKKSAQPVLQPR